LQEAFELSRQQVEDAVNPSEVAAIFEREKVSYALIGGHMVSFYTGNARATVTVDFIVGGAHFARAAKAIDKAYSQFKQNGRVYHVTYDSKKGGPTDAERIDLVRDGFPLFREVVTRYCHAVKTDSHTVKIPTIEAAIALKFAASISPNRGVENKPVDNADLLRLIRSTLRIDDKVLLTLGDFIYRGGGKELIALVADIRAGKPVRL
jgi:hypothetical protein